MKAGIFLMKHARSPQNEAKVPFRMDLPLVLRNHVTPKNNINKEQGCFQEIQLVLACLERNNFENKMCTEEVTKFQNCYKTFLRNKNATKSEIMKGNLVPGAKNLKYKQLNKLLAKYPQVN